jgi:cytochrome P460
MNRQHIVSAVVASASIFVVSLTLVAQDRFAVKSPNGIAFSEFKGYDSWQVMAPSQTDAGMGCMTAPCVKAILGNAAIIKAFSDGAPANGKAFPDGAMIAKVEWAKITNPASPYAVIVPGALNDISFMVKDSKRFPDTDGWGYAQFRYNAASKTFAPYGNGPAFAKKDCHQCHINGAKARDFVYTGYAPR